MIPGREFMVRRPRRRQPQPHYAIHFDDDNGHGILTKQPGLLGLPQVQPVRFNRQETGTAADRPVAANSILAADGFARSTSQPDPFHGRATRFRL